MDQLKYFWNTYDFDRVMSWIGTALRDPLGTLMNPWILAPIVIIIGLFVNQKTAGLGQKLIIGVPAIGYLFITLTVLHNDSISQPGPFMMGLGAMLIIVGWFIWDRLMKG
ncbi:MAG: hypothetical protein HQK87_00020 [Nitrospinae bacterium]|nr:hypothetical protein [Nitrospinota bacterium]